MFYTNLTTSIVRLSAIVILAIGTSGFANAATMEKIVNAIKQGELKEIVQKEPSLVNARIDIEETSESSEDNYCYLLHIAVLLESVDDVKFLLEQGAHPNAYDSSGFIPIAYAAKQPSEKNKEIIRYFVANDSDEEETLDSCITRLPEAQRHALNVFGFSSSRKEYFAMRDKIYEQRREEINNYKKVIKIATENIDLTKYKLKKPDNDIQLKFCEAVKKGSLKEVQTLVEQGANVNFVDENGNTPLRLILRRERESDLDRNSNVDIPSVAINRHFSNHVDWL
jgi:hypothetical protein